MGKVKDLHIKIYLFQFLNICGLKNEQLQCQMTADCVLGQAAFLALSGLFV